MLVDIPDDWMAPLDGETEKPYFAALCDYVDAERTRGAVYPPEEDVFNALKMTPFDRVRVVLLGQDPYHGPGQAHGLCFSVRDGVPPPPSLGNIFRELRDDLGFAVPGSGNLTRWAEQGVLMLNAVLTVRAHEANSHKNRGWESFTDAVIRAVYQRPTPVVSILWGAYAQKKAKAMASRPEGIVQSAHPSPLSARNGFFGSRPFSRVNALLEADGLPPIDWRLTA